MTRRWELRDYLSGIEACRREAYSVNLNRSAEEVIDCSKSALVRGDSVWLLPLRLKAILLAVSKMASRPVPSV
jgi:hypothetical protein